MFMKKFIPWKKNVGSANEEEVVPEKGDVASEKKEKKEEGDKGALLAQHLMTILNLIGKIHAVFFYKNTFIRTPA